MNDENIEQYKHVNDDDDDDDDDDVKSCQEGHVNLPCIVMSHQRHSLIGHYNMVS